MRYKESGSSETKSLEVDVTIPKDTSAEKKAELVEAAIDAQNNSNVRTEISAIKKSKINITGGNGATIKSADISGASGEARDTIACDDSITYEFTCTLAGDLKTTDLDGEAAIVAVDTARGLIEVDLTTVDSLEQAFEILVQGLEDLGLSVTVVGTLSLKFEMEADLDQEAIFGCTDYGMTITGSMAHVEPAAPARA